MFKQRILDSYTKPLGIFMKDGDDDGGGGGGGQDSDWKDSLPDELKTDASLLDVPDVATLAKRFVDTKAMVGNSFRVPGEGAGKEDWDKFTKNLMDKVPNLMYKPDASDKEALETIYDQMGRPEKPEEYEVPEIDDQGLTLNMDMADPFKQIAHKYGLNKQQYQGVIKDLTEVSINAALESRSNVDADVKSLVDEWGMAYERNKSAAIAIAKQTGAPENIVNLVSSATPPSELVKYFYGLSASLKGEGLNLSGDQGSGGHLTPTEAQEQMSEMRRNPDHPLNVVSDPGHANALARYKGLAKYAYPKGPQG